MSDKAHTTGDTTSAGFIDSVLIHCHIPKTGGTSLITMADRMLGPRVVKFDFYLGVIEQDAYPLIRTAYFYAKFITSQNARYVDIETVWPGVKFLVILRDPIERFLSAYHFHHHITGSVSENDDIVPEEKMETGAPDIYERIPRLANAQTRFLANHSQYHSIDEERLSFAKEQLVKYHYLALTERSMDIPKMLSSEFPDLGRMESLAVNTTPGRQKHETWVDRTDPKIVSRIRDANTLDLKLYEFAQELYEKRFGAIA